MEVSQPLNSTELAVIACGLFGVTSGDEWQAVSTDVQAINVHCGRPKRIIDGIEVASYLFG
jgi:hypothetical protein